MTVKQILEMGLVKNDTTLYIRRYGEDGMIVAACGNWYQDNVLNYLDCEVESFTWQDDNNFFIDIK